MKVLRYMLNGNECEMSYSPENEKIAKAEADGGVYTIEENGRMEQMDSPNLLDKLEAQVVYTAMMTDTLLEE